MTSEEYKACGGVAYPTHGHHWGMTLRDFFAAHALTGLLAFSPEGCNVQLPREDAVADAYAIADEMIAYRKDCPIPDALPESAPAPPEQQHACS